MMLFWGKVPFFFLSLFQGLMGSRSKEDWVTLKEGGGLEDWGMYERVERVEMGSDGWPDAG